nr:tet_MFS_efflux [uncultured bacterium]
MNFIIDHFIIDKVNIDKVNFARSEKGTLFTVLVTVTLDAAGLGLVMPILPTLLEQAGAAFQVIPLYVGLLTGLYALMQFFFAPILGRASDRFGRRPVLIVSLVGATLDYMILATTSNLAVFFVARAISGITGATNAVSATVIADITENSERAQRYGWLAACYGAGMIGGPVIGGLFGAVSPRLPFLIASVLCGINLALSIFVLSETLEPSKESHAVPVHSRVRALGAVPGMTGILVVFGLVQFVGQAPGSAWVLFTEQRFDWDPLTVGISLSIFGLIQVAVQATLTGRIVASFGEVKAILTGIVADSVGLVGLAFAVQSWQILPIMIALGLGSMTVPAIQTLVSQRVPQKEQGHLQGILASLNSFTSIIGPISFTGIFALTRGGADGTLWLCAAALYLPCAILVVREATRD